MIAQLLPALPADSPAASAISRSASPVSEDGGFAGFLGPDGSESLPAALPGSAASAGEEPSNDDILKSIEAEASGEEVEGSVSELAASAPDGILDPTLLAASRPLGETAIPEVQSDRANAASRGADVADPSPLASASAEAVGFDVQADAGAPEDPAAAVNTVRRISRGDIMSAAFSVMERPADRQAEPASVMDAPVSDGPVAAEPGPAEAELPHAADLASDGKPGAGAPQVAGPSRPIPVAAPADQTAVLAESASSVELEPKPAKEVSASGPSAPGSHADEAAPRPAPTLIAASASQNVNDDATTILGETRSPEPAPDQAEMPTGFEPASARSEMQPVAAQVVHAPAAARFRSPLARSVATQLAGTSLEEGSVTIRLRPHGMGVIEIEIARGAQGQMEVAMRVQNPMVLDALRAERSALSDLLSGGGAQPEALDFALFQHGGEGQQDGRENRDGRTAGASNMLPGADAVEGISAPQSALSASGVPGSILTDIIA